MTKDGLMTEREQIIRYVAVEWYRWNLGSNYSQNWDLRDVRQALILRLADFMKYAKYHGNYDFTKREVLDFYKNWNVGGCAIG